MVRVVVIGDANAGLIFANKLRMHTNINDVKITLIGNSVKTYFKPDGVLIPFNDIDYHETVRNTDSLIHYGIERIKALATFINPDDHYVKLDNSKVIEYDYLVIATGDRLSTGEINGYSDSVLHFYDLNNALKLKQELNNIKSGNVVIGPARLPFQCPMAPYEFAFELKLFLKKRHLDNSVKITVISPMDGALPFNELSNNIIKRLSNENIEFHGKFESESIDREKKVLKSTNGETINFDHLVLIPVHHGQKFLIDSGLANENGYVDVDKYKLNYKNYDNLFVIGDAANFMLKVGAFGHSQASYLARYIAAETSGFTPDDYFDGYLGCSSVVDNHTGMTLSFDYDSKPKANFSSFMDYYLKYISANVYFSSIIHGVL